MKPMLPQQCPMAFLYLTWAFYGAGFVYLALGGEYIVALAWVVFVPLVLWAYVRVFPGISHYLGYGRVDDVAAEVTGRHSVQVTMYGSLGCPFCPIVQQRLEALRDEMGFELEHIDVTLRPGLLKAKRIKSVPVVEVGDRQLVGNATTRELAELVRAAE
ncbi:MAG: glutaredoxin family protein [Gemmatimonadota bacterium]|jgi:glutaredoxin